ncbi:MAG: hypothetical protein MMC33_010436 [Icmadophila ericetorum]|nr:hypothetical protein [Icmadophila ericetorum]
MPRKETKDYRNSLLTRYLSLTDWPLDYPTRKDVAKAGFYRDPHTTGLTNVTCCRCLVTCRLQEGSNLIAAHRGGFEFGRTPEEKEEFIEDVQRKTRLRSSYYSLLPYQ